MKVMRMKVGSPDWSANKASWSQTRMCSSVKEWAAFQQGCWDCGLCECRRAAGVLCVLPWPSPPQCVHANLTPHTPSLPHGCLACINLPPWPTPAPPRPSSPWHRPSLVRRWVIFFKIGTLVFSFTMAGSRLRVVLLVWSHQTVKWKNLVKLFSFRDSSEETGGWAGEDDWAGTHIYCLRTCLQWGIRLIVNFNLCRGLNLAHLNYLSLRWIAVVVNDLCNRANYTLSSCFWSLKSPASEKISSALAVISSALVHRWGNWRLSWSRRLRRTAQRTTPARTGTFLKTAAIQTS